MGFKGGKKGKSGSYSTSADVLEKLCSQSLDLPKRVLEWRQLSKLKSTYTDVLIDQIDPKTGRVHTTYSMTVTSTGRLASSNPNLQNIPIRSEEGLKIRRAFVAAPRQKFMSFDYSQIELRLLAHVAQIEELKEAFHEGLDIHKLTASQVFRVPLEDVDDKMRFRAKAINFGIVYGISAFGLANQLDISNYEAAQHIKAYLQQYPGISRYMKQTKMFARKHGYVQIIFGRRCYITDINSRNPARQRLAERQAINAPLQGGQADIIKRAMVKVPDVLNKAGLKAKMLVQVHDELIFEVPEKEVEQTGKIVKEIMEKAAYLDVPLVVDVGVGDNWAET
jgi:DNA polymerase-1